MTLGYEGRESYEVADFDGDPTSLVAAMKHANELRLFPDRGTLWWLHSGAGSLLVGVRGDRGMLTWMDRSGAQLRPREAENSYFADYFTWAGDRFRQAPRRELPIERVFDAVCDLVTTSERPTCLEWIEDFVASCQEFEDADTLALVDLMLLGALPDKMRTLATSPHEGREAVGRVWTLIRDFKECAPVLFAGVRGDLGYLAWRDEAGQMFVPADGRNPSGRYLTRRGNALALVKGGEVELTAVIQAVVDFTGWRRQPSSFAWKPARSATTPS